MKPDDVLKEANKLRVKRIKSLNKNDKANFVAETLGHLSNSNKAVCVFLENDTAIRVGMYETEPHEAIGFLQRAIFMIIATGEKEEGEDECECEKD